LLSVAAIAIIAGMGIPVYQLFQNRNDLDIATVTIAQSARRAQVLSQAVDGDISWGITIQSGSVVIFKGPSYAGRDSIFDEVFEVSTSITQSGMSEIVFAKFTGLPQTTGTITLTSANNETRNVIVNSKGMIDY
jgi:Tfp pilus assembly major pilin PilA